MPVDLLRPLDRIYSAVDIRRRQGCNVLGPLIEISIIFYHATRTVRIIKYWYWSYGPLPAETVVIRTPLNPLNLAWTILESWILTACYRSCACRAVYPGLSQSKLTWLSNIRRHIPSEVSRISGLWLPTITNL